MIGSMIAGLKVEAQYMARRTGFAVGGAVFMFVGFLFLAAAGWILLAEWRDPLFATLICGAVFFGIGLILMALSRRSYRASDLRTAAATGAEASRTGSPTRAALPPMAEAFMVGLSAGMRR